MAAGHDPRQLQGVVLEAAPSDATLEFRPMFGGIMAYAGGRPFASLSNRGLALKLGVEAQAALRALPGARPLRYELNDPPSKTYTLVPDTMLAAPGDLRVWLEQSIDFIATQPRPKRKPVGRPRDNA